MTILVTGGAGYIATHTIVALYEAGHKVISFDNHSNSSPKALERVEQIVGQPIKAHTGDIRSKDQLKEIFKKNDIDTVIHFAALKAVGESTKKPLKYFDNNISGLITLLEVMKDFDIKNMVFSSSATVYGDSNPMPLLEDMPIGQVTNPYGRTKVIGEQILMDIAKADSSWAIALLRYFNPVGAHPSGLIGENPLGKPSNLMPFITQVAVGRLKHINIFGSDYNTKDGTAIRDYIHIMDLARGHVRACEYILDNKGIDIFNLGRGEGYTVLEVIDTFERVTGQEIPRRLAPRRKGDAEIVYANCDKAKAKLGWSAKYDLEKMCQDSWRWQRENPKGYR